MESEGFRCAARSEVRRCRHHRTRRENVQKPAKNCRHLMEHQAQVGIAQGVALNDIDRRRVPGPQYSVSSLPRASDCSRSPLPGPGGSEDRHRASH